jgi:Fe-S-cluster containining protein
MGCIECGTCCQDTEMLLLKKDIERLRKKGYNSKFFSRKDKDFYIILRNKNGYCVFFDRNKKKCKVYKDRPMGCRLYPIIFDDSKGVVIDKICPASSSWSEKSRQILEKKVIRVIKKLDIEANQRCSS